MASIGKRRVVVSGLATLSAVLTVQPTDAGFVLPSPSAQIYYTTGAAAGSRLEIEQGVRATGRLVSNDDVLLKTGSAVTGDVTAVGTISGGGTVTGTRARRENWQQECR